MKGKFGIFIHFCIINYSVKQEIRVGFYNQEKIKKSYSIIAEVFVPVMDNYGITLFYKFLKDMRMLSTK